MYNIHLIYILCVVERVTERKDRERENYVVLQNFFDLITIEFDVFLFHNICCLMYFMAFNY